jgi:hypothetical protein
MECWSLGVLRGVRIVPGPRIGMLNGEPARSLPDADLVFLRCVPPAHSCSVGVVPAFFTDREAGSLTGPTLHYSNTPIAKS